MIRSFTALFAIVLISPTAISFTYPSASIFLPHTNHKRQHDDDDHPSASINTNRRHAMPTFAVVDDASHTSDDGDAIPTDITTKPSPSSLPIPMSSQNMSIWGRSPYLALLTEPDACTSLQRVEETIHAIDQATMDGGVTLVVVRVTMDDSSSDGTSIKHNKWALLKNLADMKKSRRGGRFLLIVNDDVDIVVRALTHNIAVDGVHVKEHNAHLIPSIRGKLEHATTATSSNPLLNDDNQKHETIIIGTSCHSLPSAIASYQLSPRGPDYLFVGTCYLTQSHPEKTLSDQLEGPTLPGRIKRELHQIFNNTTAHGSSVSSGNNDETMSQSSPPSSTVLSPPPIIFAIGGINEQNCHEPVVTFGADGVATIRTVMQASNPLQIVHCMKEAMHQE